MIVSHYRRRSRIWSCCLETRRPVPAVYGHVERRQSCCPSRMTGRRGLGALRHFAS